MKSNKRNILSILSCAVLMLLCSLVSGCVLSCEKSTLTTPVVTLYDENKCIVFNGVKGAVDYKIICNDEVVDVVEHDYSSSMYLYEFDNILDADGDYEFQVIACPKTTLTNNSIPSNAVKYNHVARDVYYPGTHNTAVETSTDYTISGTLNGTILTFSPLAIDVDEYEMYLYSNVAELKRCPLDSITPDSTGKYSIKLLSSEYGLEDSIYMIRLGYVDGDKHYVASDVFYFNPDSHGTYTSKYFLFDGYINDYYMETLDEFRRLVHYSFITRNSTNIPFKCSPQLEQLFTDYYGTNTGDFNKETIIKYAVADAFNYFLETREAYLINALYDRTSGQESTYKFVVNYNAEEYLNREGNSEPYNDIEPPYYAYQEIDWDTYYETCGLTMRAESLQEEGGYHTFVSDKQFLSVEVSSSEELYWAVENKFTPICKEGSRAADIYNDAKQVLNDIISYQMNDYQKALAIFDWICSTTSYDYYSNEEGAYDGIASTLMPAFYLEGVFDTKYAVCDGFSKAYSLMCNMEGIDCIRVTGYGKSYDEHNREVWHGHAWNKVFVDPNLNDGIQGNYYLVDITWAEMMGSTLYEGKNREGEEVTTHDMFLISDKSVKDTHRNYEERDKFNHYEAPNNYNYYENTTFNFDPKDYMLAISSQETTFDLVIESDDELTAMLYYVLVNQRDSIEVVFDLKYMQNIVSEKGGDISNYSLLVSELQNKIKSKKFLTQAFDLNTIAGVYTTIKYNDKGDIGLLIVMENLICIDDDGEVGHMLSFFDKYDLTGNYTLIVRVEMVNFDAEDYLDLQTDSERIAYWENLINNLIKSESPRNTTLDISIDLLATDLYQVLHVIQGDLICNMVINL